MGVTRRKIHLKSATPTVDTSAYASGDRLGSLMTISTGQAEEVILLDVVVTDRSAQSAAINLLFFNSEPTIASADNAALSIADAEMEKLVGRVSIPAANYQGATGSSGGSVNDINMVIDCNSDGNFYVLAVSAGTPTYAGATDLKFTFACEEV